MPTNFRITLPEELRKALDEKKALTAHIPYNDFVEGLAKQLNNVAEEMHHSTTGMSGEAGELLDITKKLWIYEKPVTLDVLEHLIEELGDVRWYYQLMLNTLGITDEDVRAFNKAKLLKRYPGGVYSNEAALNRADKKPEPGAASTRKFFGKPDEPVLKSAQEAGTHE